MCRLYAPGKPHAYVRLCAATPFKGEHWPLTTIQQIDPDGWCKGHSPHVRFGAGAARYAAIRERVEQKVKSKEG